MVSLFGRGFDSLQLHNKKMKKIVFFLLAVFAFLPVEAQQTEMAQQRQNIQLAQEPEKENSVKDFFKDYFKKYFHHLDVGVTLGTTGLGVDVSMPVYDNVCLRTGFNYMPRVEVPMTFGIQVGDDPTRSASKFAKMASVLQDITGNPVDDHVEMLGKAKMWNWNLLVDVYPLKQNKHWRVTAGFFLGPSTIAESFNKTESMASLVAVGIYNNMYDKLHGKTKRELAGVKLIDLSVLGDEYKDLHFDLDMLLTLQKGFDSAGRMGIHLGDFKDKYVTDENGEIVKDANGNPKKLPYFMTPDDDDMVKANLKVNAFKPYIGFGYEGRLVKGNDRLTVSVDAGIMMWGGKPSLLTHDGTDLINDVEGVTGKVGDYVSVMSNLAVFPVANVRFAYTIF